MKKFCTVLLFLGVGMSVLAQGILKKATEGVDFSYANEILGKRNVSIRQSATYKKKIFEVKLSVEPSDTAIDVVSLLLASSAMQIVYEEEPIQSLMADVLILDDKYPGFLSEMKKTNSSYRLQIEVPYTGYRFSRELSSAELSQIDLNAINLTDFFWKKYTAMVNKIFLPLKCADGSVLQHLAYQGSRIVAGIKVSDKQMQTIKKNISTAKKTFFSPSASALGNSLDIEAGGDIDYTFMLTSDGGGKLELSCTKEERKEFAKMDEADRQMYELELDIKSGLPQKVSSFQYLVDYYYADRTIVFVDSLSVDDDKWRKAYTSPSALQIELTKKILGTTSSYEYIANKGIALKQIFRGLSSEDVSYTMTAPEVKRIATSTPYQKDSMKIANMMLLRSLRYESNDCSKVNYCLKRESMEGNYAVLSVICNASPQDSRKVQPQHDSRSRAIDFYKSRKGSNMRHAVNKLHMGFIYRVFDKDMKNHDDIIIPYEEISKVTVAKYIVK